jgi:hypothetical protein
VPVDQVPARALAVCDVVRLADPQALRVERVLVTDSRVVLEMRPVGLAVDESVRVTLQSEAVVDRLGLARE